MHIVIHYDEIAIKGQNRSQFENLLIRNMKAKLGSRIESVKKEFGQIYIKANPDAKKEEIQEILTKMPGVSFFSFAEKTSLEIEDIKSSALDFLRDKKFETFKVFSQRHNKSFPMDSMELNKVLGETLNKEYKKKVIMKNPDITLKVEISDDASFISSEDVAGVGGLPTDSRQKVVALLSGGFDSPVAAYLMMKRGCEVIFVHFHNKNQMSVSVEDKIVQLAKQLSKFQQKTKLYIVPFEDVQKEIIMKVHSEVRMLVYRRFMLKISAKIAAERNAKFLVVGDSLCQVASQTFENLAATYSNIGMNIFSPLIGLDKKEIIAIARKIGTADISSLPYGDCCSFFIAKHPELKAEAEILDKYEEKIDNKIIEECLKKAKVMEF